LKERTEIKAGQLAMKKTTGQRGITTG
jgi:hypothetical protein